VERNIKALALLDDRVRRSLYFYVADQRDYTGRDAAAQAVRVSRNLAAFHLDKLAAAGLLEVIYRRPPDRKGPGGRPMKLYRRARSPIALSLPSRQYESLARIFARALARDRRQEFASSLHAVAQEFGAAIGGETWSARGGHLGRGNLVKLVVDTLERQGFEPYWVQRDLCLRNCPFHALVDEHRDLICNTNLATMQGLLSAAHLEGFEAEYRPAPDRCCVVLRDRSVAGLSGSARDHSIN
jgi:predicted ArsR family transcriptional regulator